MSVSIHPIHMGVDTIYVVRGEGVIVIDGGNGHTMERFRQGIAEASIRPEEIQLILLTHGHWDHIGCTRDIKDLTGAKVFLHRRDMHLLEGAHPSQPPGLTAWGKIVTALVRLYLPSLHIPPFEVDIVGGDDEMSLTEYGIPGKVIYTPGHSWGSVSVLLDSGEVFAGDMAMNAMPMRLTPGLPVFGDDIEVVKEGWRKLLAMGATTVFPAHGQAFSAQVMRKEVM